LGNRETDNYGSGFFFSVNYLYHPNPTEFFTVSDTGRELIPFQGRCTTRADSLGCIDYPQIVAKCFGWKLLARSTSSPSVMAVYRSSQMSRNRERESHRWTAVALRSEGYFNSREIIKRGNILG